MAAWLMLALSLGNADSANADGPSWRSRNGCVFSVAGARTPHHGTARGIPGDAMQSARIRKIAKNPQCYTKSVKVPGRPWAIHAILPWQVEGLYEVHP